MLLHHPLPKKADIFDKTRKAKFYNLSYKPFKNLKKIGIIIGGFFIILGLAILLAPGKQVNKSAQAMVTCPFQANNATSGCNYSSWNNNNNNNNNQNVNNNLDNSNSNTGDVNVPITPFPQNNFIIDTTPNTPTQQIPTVPTLVSPGPAISPLPTNQNQPTGQDIGSINAQIIQIQQQIGQQMQACVNNAQQMANQIAQMQAQQNNLQNQLNAINNLNPNFDTSTTQGQQRQQAFQQQQQQKQQQLQNQLNDLSNAINQAQNNMNNANSQCQQNVSQLEQNRGQLENNLDQAFSNAMNIQIPQPQ